MLILGIDFETTWTSPVNVMLARPLEIGAVLWETETKKPAMIYSNFLFESDHPRSPLELVELTGITDDMRERFGVSPRTGLSQLNALMRMADYIVAHNGNEFDKPIYFEECGRLGLEPVHKKWLDTKTDLPLPPTIKTTKLTYLAAEHGFANPFAHRAVFDVLTMLKILDIYDIKKVVELSLEPSYRVVASVSYNDRNLAKDRGFHWDGENKRWMKVVKKSNLEKETNDIPFTVMVTELTKELT